MSLLTDLQSIAEHLSPSDVVAGEAIVGALIKVLEHNGLQAPAVEELLPEDHPARIQPPAPAAPADQPKALGDLHDRLTGLEDLIKGLVGHSSSEPGPAQAAGPETSAPSSEPAAPAVEQP